MGKPVSPGRRVAAGALHRGDTSTVDDLPCADNGSGRAKSLAAAADQRPVTAGRRKGPARHFEAVVRPFRAAGNSGFDSNSASACVMACRNTSVGG